MTNFYFIGSAGSGKTTMTGSFKSWLNNRGLDAVTVNLDPGVEWLPYSPDIDIREWVNLQDVMGQYGVGPNGGQIIAADMVAINIAEIRDIMDEFKSNFFLIDTPGQMELFTLRKASSVIIDVLGRQNSLVNFLFDPFLSTSPSGFVALLMQSLSTQFMLNLPIQNLLTKTDLVEEEEVEKVLGWSYDPYKLYDSLVTGQGMVYQSSIEFFRALETLDAYNPLIPISSENWHGFEDVYTLGQQIFYGGEDLEEKEDE